MKKMSKLLAIILLCFTLPACSSEQNTNIIEEEINMVLHDKMCVAYDLGMVGRPRGLNWLIAAMFRDHEVIYENCYLFPDEASANAAVEAGQIGDNDVYGFADALTIKRINFLNWTLYYQRTAHLITKYNLEYPLTVDDLVNQPEDMWQLINDRDIISQIDYNDIVSTLNFGSTAPAEIYTLSDGDSE